MTDQALHNTEPLDDGTLVKLQGDIDLSRSPDIRHLLLQLAAEQPKRLVIDLTGVDYMDSSGVATLVEALQHQRRHNGKLILCGLSDKVRGIFEISRLDMVFTIADDLETARTA